LPSLKSAIELPVGWQQYVLTAAAETLLDSWQVSLLQSKSEHPQAGFDFAETYNSTASFMAKHWR